MLSISDFSHLCQLSAKALRFYHSEGLVVPAVVDENSGYRWYMFDQAERAMMVKVLRATGMSIKAVRQALEEPDTALGLLRRHRADQQRQRAAEDEATGEAEDLLHSRPEVNRIDVPEMTVVSTPVPGPAAPEAEDYDWEQADRIATQMFRDIKAAVESAGGSLDGTPWLTMALENQEQKAKAYTPEGPHWLIKVPVDLEAKTATLPEHMQVQTFDAREELSIFIPGRNTTAKSATALARLIAYEIQDATPDPLRLRVLMHEDGNETTVAITRVEPGNPTGSILTL